MSNFWELDPAFFALSAAQQSEVLEINDAAAEEVFANDSSSWTVTNGPSFEHLSTQDQNEVNNINQYLENFSVGNLTSYAWGGRVAGDGSIQEQVADSIDATEGAIEVASQNDPPQVSDDIAHELVETRERTALGGRVRHCVARVVLRGANDVVHNGRILDVVASLFSKIEELYQRYVVENAKTLDEAQMILWTNSMENPISTPFRKVSDLSVDHLLTVVSKSQNSGVTISFKDHLIIEFVHIKADPAWGPTAPQVNGGRGVVHLMYFGNEGKKRSLKSIADSGDNLCLAKCLVLGNVHCKYQLVRQDNKIGARRKVEEESLARDYKKMGRKRKTNSFLDEKVDTLYELAGVEKGAPGDLVLVKKFEQVLGVCVKVVSLKHQLQVIYKGQPTGTEMIYILYSEDPKTKIGHYSLITNICGFYAKEFYCLVCDVAYNNIYDHRCPDVRDWCYACYDRFCKGKPVEKCKTCKILFRSLHCRKRHRLAKCKERWRCPRCRRKIKRKKIPDPAASANQLRHMTNEEMEADHNCDEYYCTECKEEVGDAHRCYIRKKKLEPKLYKFIFYDFETDQSSGLHVVNFAHMKYFLRDPVAEAFDEAAKLRCKNSGQDDDDVEDYDDSHLSDHTQWEGEWIEKSFKGVDALTQFLAFVSKITFKGYTAIAHNMRGFDGIFILRELLENGVIPDVIVKGQKIMVMTIPDVNLRFVDSFNFLPMGLAKLPGAFGLDCGSKGYFPHFFNTPENWEYCDKLPAPHFYGVDQMSVSEREKFEKWYDEQIAADVVFDFQSELAAYCIQDVNILAESCLAYRRIMCLETECDPFAYLTCASVCNAVYNSNFMPSEAIARVPPDGYPHARYSDVSCEWLEYLLRFCGVSDMIHAGNSPTGEKRIGRYSVDGFSPATKTVYEFYGCWFHGCKECFPDDKCLRNPDTQKLLSVSYRETMEREQWIKEAGYNLVCMWGCKWQQMKSSDPDVQKAVKDMAWVSPLNPRDGFFGGRTETFKLECSTGPMGYEDVTSLYPYVNFRMPYPVGHPRVITHNFSSIYEYFGIVKCTVLPPKDLYIPVLPMHCGPTNKLIFPLCSTCALAFQTSPCKHTNEERAITGTFFTEELKMALDKRYVLLKIHSVWHFEKKSDELFREYVKTFYKKKLLSSKLPFKSEGEVCEFMRAVLEKEQISIQAPTDFCENPGLRQLTKLMLNNLWGRYGMRQNLSKSVFISDVGPLVALMLDPTVEVQGVRVISDDAVQVIHRAKSDQFLPTAKGTNVYIAVATTAWARIKLYQQLDKLRERVLYCDTDSVIYRRSQDPAQNLVTGNFLGEMTDELSAGDCITDFVSGGPKNYGYITQKGNVVVKVKGFTLNSVNSPAFSFQNVKRVIMSGVVVPADLPVYKADGSAVVGAEVVGSCLRKRSLSAVSRLPLKCPKKRKLEVESLRKGLLDAHLQIDSWQSAVVHEKCISVYNAYRIQRTSKWQVKRTPEQKVYSFCFDKRIILSNNDTVPYGYVGPLG